MDLKWNIRVMMAHAKIHSAAELHRQLTAKGISISHAQVSRIVKKKPSRINTHLFCTLCGILNCGVNDLLQKIDSPHKPVSNTDGSSVCSRVIKFHPKQ